jgi:hypothetical protein
MTDPVDLDALTRNTRRLEFEDGLNDIQNAILFLLLGSMGALFMSTAGIELYMRAMLVNSEITTIALLALIPLFILITFGVRRVITGYRKRVLWSHLGEIEPFRWQVESRVSVLATVIWLLVVIVGLVIVDRPTELDADMRVIIAAGGVATGVVYYALGHTLKLNRYRWVGVTGAVLSMMLMILPVEVTLSWVSFGLVWTLILLISGISAFRETQARLRGGAA